MAGFWLGVSQLALAFQLLFTQGSNVIYYFFMIAVWLTGSCIGLFLPTQRKVGSIILIFAVMLFAVAATVSRSDDNMTLSMVVILLSAIVSSCYAGWLLRSRSILLNAVKDVLFLENTGFIIGFALTSVLLLTTLWFIDYLSLGSGIVLLLITFATKSEGSSHSKETA